MKKILKKLLAVGLTAGMIFGAVNISYAEWEGINYANGCNTAEDIPSAGAVLIDDDADRAPDGTAYIKASDVSSDWLYAPKAGGDPLDIAFEAVFSSKAVSAFCAWETDIKFGAEAAGFSIRDASGAKQGKVNTTIVYGSGAIRFSKPDGTKICDAEIGTWYNIKLVGVYGLGSEDAVMKVTVSEYLEDGSAEMIAEVEYPGEGKHGDLLRNDKAPTRFAVNPNTSVDNMTVCAIQPAALDIVQPEEDAVSMTAGEEQQLDVQLYADAERTMPMPDVDIVYELWNADASDYLISDTVTVTPETGLLKVSAQAQTQTFIVRARCADFPDIYDEISVNVEEVPILQFIGAGFDETYSTLINLKFDQNYENEGDLQVLTAFYDADGVLVDMFVKDLAYADQRTGETIVTLNRELPENFDINTGKIKVFVWSKTIE